MLLNSCSFLLPAMLSILLLLALPKVYCLDAKTPPKDTSLNSSAEVLPYILRRDGHEAPAGSMSGAASIIRNQSPSGHIFNSSPSNIVKPSSSNNFNSLSPPSNVIGSSSGHFILSAPSSAAAGNIPTAAQNQLSNTPENGATLQPDESWQRYDVNWLQAVGSPEMTSSSPYSSAQHQQNNWGASPILATLHLGVLIYVLVNIVASINRFVVVMVQLLIKPLHGGVVL